MFGALIFTAVWTAVVALIHVWPIRDGGGIPFPLGLVIPVPFALAVWAIPIAIAWALVLALAL